MQKINVNIDIETYLTPQETLALKPTSPSANGKYELRKRERNTPLSQCQEDRVGFDNIIKSNRTSFTTLTTT